MKTTYFYYARGRRFFLRFAIVLILPLSLTVTLPLPTSASGSNALGDWEDFFDSTFGDLTEELDLLKEEEKSHLLVVFESKDCPWCERMKKQVLNRVTVQQFYHGNFRNISLSVEGDVLLTDFTGAEIVEKDFALKVLRVRATPAFVFFNRQGEVAAKYTGALTNAEDFILLGQYVAEKKYELMGFNKYKRAL